MRHRAIAGLLALSLAAAFSPARAEGTTCFLGSPTPGFAAMRFDLPEGSSFLTLALNGLREDQRVLHSDDNYRLAQGIFVLEATSMELVAYRIQSIGMTPRTVIVSSGDTQQGATIESPEVPYEHYANGPSWGLPAGSYYVIAFGTDGGKAPPNEYWFAGINIEGTHQCKRIGSGETFDFDHTDFDGDQIYAPGIGRGQALRRSMTTDRRVVVGIMQAHAMLADVSEASLTYETPTDSGEVNQGLVPFVSTSGDYSFEASYSGYHPYILVTGVGLDLSL